jgi:IPT/TIG domain
MKRDDQTHMNLIARTMRRLINDDVVATEDGGTTVDSSPRADDESGAVLILALMFLVVIALLVGGLASWTANGLRDTLTFQQERTAQYALTSTTQVAIQSIRYTPLLGANQTVNASPPTYCWGSVADSYGGTELTTQNTPVEVYCSTVWTPTSAATRVVTISACLQSQLPVPANAASSCADNPGLQTIVTFDDYSSTNPIVNQGACVTTCGNGMTINSSISKTTAPTVTSLSSTSGPVYPVAPNNTLTITGTEFESGSTTCSLTNPAPGCGDNEVAFVATTPSLNISVPATVTAATSTSLTVTVPPTTTVTSYYVIVTTPNGSSAAGAQATYNFTSVTPTVSSIKTVSADSSLGQQVSGSAAGGTAIVITGTGFLSNSADQTQVWFYDTSGVAPRVQATSLMVNSSTSITATTPSVSSANLTYDVVVITAPGAMSQKVPADVFTFQVLNPVVGGVSPASGTGGSQVVTITGIGFVNGASTVTLVPTTGNTLTATNVTVTSSTSLTATIPTGGTKGKVYAVEVATSGGNSGVGGVANQYTY